MIGPDTQLCGIILHPAEHTRSPAMHNAAFEALGIDARYLAFDVAPAALAEAVRGARAFGIRQLAVSLPHKQAVMEHVDEVDEIARTIGAVNTVTLRDGRLLGANTDWSGILHALERETELEGKRAVVLGAGGTARAAVHALRRAGARVAVLNRTRAKADAIARDLGADQSGPLEALADIDHDVVVNTTSVGLRSDESPVPAAALQADSVVFDAIYDPAETRLLRDAAAAGARTVGGKWMLVHQAAEQIHLWTHQRPDPDLMAKAFDRATV